MKQILATAAFSFFLLSCSSQSVADGEQGPDMEADVSVATPLFTAGDSPRVTIDGAHGNFHTVDGSYAPFANLLRNDGLNVEAGDAPFTPVALAGTDLLVISNAETAKGSAFTDAEIAAVRDYVENGGALLLIVDHWPFPPASSDLAAAFGANWLNVYSDNRNDGRITRRSGDLIDSPVTAGVDSVRMFGGSCFTAPGMNPVLRAGNGWSIQSPNADETGLSEKVSADGCLLGAVAEVGQGRIAFFAEAAMFSAQNLTVDGRTRAMGFNARGAEDNRTLILNLTHWLLRADQN